MQVLPKAPFLVLNFYFALIIFQIMLSVILHSLVMIELSTL